MTLIENNRVHSATSSTFCSAERMIRNYAIILFSMKFILHDTNDVNKIGEGESETGG